MKHLSEMSFLELLDPKGHPCPSCGRHHTTGLKLFEAGRGAVKQLPQMLKKLNIQKPFIVCDQNTYKAAGEQVEALLTEAGIPYKLFTLTAEHVEPDEFSVGSILLAYDPSSDGVISVGSGVINDCCKVVAHAVGKPQVAVGTAPSMDGYASDSSSMHVSGVKSTVYNACPIGIICDSEIMCQAPMRMLWAGLGDMLAKYVSVCEWRLSNLVTGEYYCEEIAGLMRASLKKIVENANAIATRDPDAIQAVSEGLVMSGVAMSFALMSRPASGLEHYFSHMWEMMGMERGEKADLHGIQVGVGTHVTLGLYDWIKTLTPDRARAMDFIASFDPEAWTAMVRRIFGNTAPQILAIEEKVKKNDPENHKKRFDVIEARWPEILKIIDEEMPETAKIDQLMLGLGMPRVPKDLGISEQDAKDAYTGAREIRDKYQSCSLLWDMGLTDEARARIHAE
jgi:glycerol-1-phosphate dehydrogenase [NAD(P)+]